jgi:hypothetical protein
MGPSKMLIGSTSPAAGASRLFITEVNVKLERVLLAIKWCTKTERAGDSKARFYQQDRTGTALGDF